MVSDLRVAVIDATVSVTCTWRGGRRQWAFRGDIAADSVQFVGRLELAVPDQPGELLLGIALSGRDELSVRSVRLAAPAHEWSGREVLVPEAPRIAVGEPSMR